MEKSVRAARSLVLTLLAGSVLAAQPARAAEPPQLGAVVWMTDSCGHEAQDQAQAQVLAGTLLTLFLPTLVEGGLKLIGGAIAKAGAPSDRHVWAQQSLSLYEVKFDGADSEIPKLSFAKGCLAVAAGPKKTYAGDLQAELQNLAPLVNRNGSIALGSSTRDLLASAFDIDRTNVMTLTLSQSPDGSALRLMPVFVKLGHAFRGSETSKRGVAMTLSILAPGALADGGAVAVRTISFPSVTTPQTLTGLKATSLATSWMPLPALPEAAKARLEAAVQRRRDVHTLEKTLLATTDAAARTALTSEIARLRGFIGHDDTYLQELAPHTVRFDTHETKPGNRFLVKLGEALSGNAEKLAAPIAEHLDPAKAATRAEAAAQEEDKLRIAANTEAAALVAAEAEAATKPHAVTIARIKFEAACRQLRDAGFGDPVCAVGP